MRGLIIAAILLASTPVLAKASEPTRGWFRFDHDNLGLQLWAGATHDVGPVNISSNIYLFPQNTVCDESGSCYTFNYGELDLGLSIPIGNFLFIPMSGVGIDWELAKPVTIISPQLYAYFDVPEIHVEWWSNIAWNSPLDSALTDVWYNRLFVLYNALDELSLGPQAEVSYTLEETVDYLPVGGRVNLGYGDSNTLGLFAGYETQSTSNKLAGRITFVRYWK